MKNASGWEILLMVAAMLASCDEELSPQASTEAYALGRLSCHNNTGFDSDWKSRKAFMVYRQGYESAGCKAPRGQGE
jgi:hypothetical protein